MTYRFALHTVQEALGQTSDDKRISDVAVLFWLQLVVNKYLGRDLKRGHQTGKSLSVFTSITPVRDTAQDGQWYFDLPRGLLVADYNQAIPIVSYNRGTCACFGPSHLQQKFSYTTMEGLAHLYDNRFTKPSPSNPYYYFVGGTVDSVNVDRVYLLGCEKLTMEGLYVAMHTGIDLKTLCSLDDTIPLRDTLAETVVREVITFGRFVHMAPQDLINDGASEQAELTQLEPALPAAYQDPAE